MIVELYVRMVHRRAGDALSDLAIAVTRWHMPAIRRKVALR